MASQLSGCGCGKQLSITGIQQQFAPNYIENTLSNPEYSIFRVIITPSKLLLASQILHEFDSLNRYFTENSHWVPLTVESSPF